MVHRPADSRLLANLLAQEKDYAKHLHAVLEPAHASLSAFSAYASASAPPFSHSILAVAQSIAAADEALARYAAAVDGCREHLKDIKTMEDEVANIVRDREILVTRLIKASKAKPNQSNRRDSLQLLQAQLGADHHSSSSLSLSSASVFSSPSLATTALPASAKLSAAQAELQACEAHLAAKEQELAAGRTNALREGLSLRCRALVECGWVWGEMGKEALRVLDKLGGELSRPITRFPICSFAASETNPNVELARYGTPPPGQSQNRISLIHDDKPLPTPGEHRRAESDLSLAPSQSISQISTGEPRMSIQPAHAISDLDPYARRHVLERRITEEGQQDAEEEGGGSSAEEEQQQRNVTIKIVENPRFAAPGNTNGNEKRTIKKPANIGTPAFASDGIPTPEPSPSKRGLLGKRFSVRHPASGSPQRKRSASVSGSSTGGTGSGFFGSLRGIFGHHPSASVSAGQLSGPGGSAFFEAPASETPSKERKRGGGGMFGIGGKDKGWETRTDRNLRALSGAGAGGDSGSDSEDERAREGLALVSAPAASSKLVKGLGRGRAVSDAGAVFGSPSVGMNGSAVPNSTSPSPEQLATIPSTSTTGSSTNATGRKLKKSTTKAKNKPRSSSVPPVSSGDKINAGVISVNDSPDSGVGAGRKKTKRLASLGQSGSPSANGYANSDGKGKEKEAPVVAQDQGVREGYSVTVVGRASSPLNGQSQPTATTSDTEGVVQRKSTGKSAKKTRAGAAVGVGSGLSRNSSVRSAASAPSSTNATPQRKGSALDPGARTMPSLLRVVEDANANLVQRTNGVPSSSSPRRTQTSNNPPISAAHYSPVGPSKALSAGGTVRPAAEVPQAKGMVEIKAPARVGREDVESFSPGIVRGRSAERVGGPPLQPQPRYASMDMAIPRAPGSVFDRPSLGGGASAVAGPSGSGSGSAASSAASGSGTGLGVAPQRRPAKSPLRSALRNPSRTPSPLPPPHMLPLPQSPPPERTLPRPDHTSDTDGEHGDDESASVSSYETSREVFFDAAEDVEDIPPPPPPHDPPVHANGSPPEVPRRRKSVRVSLKPTFSPTPPALEDEDDQAEVWWANGGSKEKGKARANGETSRWGKAEAGVETPDMWQDSSDEDEEYTRARSLLSRLGRKDEKGKGRAHAGTR
ncbi:hypothetical protein H0H81_009814 [Sphagnurus paluster]|uniref:Uncharacterized protein n=1 Tax=Sphagnurus paluster TaxID=117069 RepID=A0A9P7FW41_9AGAR|nr:hypothetical protein H0H81_009814 [Sphagnurus paluster]